MSTKYDKMTPTELRIRIAELRGAKWIEWENRRGGISRALKPDNNYGYLAYEVNGIVDIASDMMPNWTGNMETAWALVFDAENNGVGFDLANYKYIHGARKGQIEYTATFFDPWGGPMHTKYMAFADTAPVAICRAWLAWKDGTN